MGFERPPHWGFCVAVLLLGVWWDWGPHSLKGFPIRCSHGKVQGSGSTRRSLNDDGMEILRYKLHFSRWLVHIIITLMENYKLMIIGKTTPSCLYWQSHKVDLMMSLPLGWGPTEKMMTSIQGHGTRNSLFLSLRLWKLQVLLIGSVFFSHSRCAHV